MANSKSKHVTAIYPWDKWFAKKSLKLKQGTHFTCQPHGMAQQIRNRAPKHGITGIHIKFELNEKNMTTLIVKFD